VSVLGQHDRAYTIDRVPARRRRHPPSAWGYGRRRARRRGGFHGPFPYYSTRTRRGSRVTVSGCCLPIPLGLVALVAAGAHLLRR
jgi:hypothetical protein